MGKVTLKGRNGDTIVAARGEIGDAVLTVPIATAGQTLGSIALGARSGRAAYTSAEIAALTHAVTVVAAALVPLIEERAAEPSMVG